MPFFTLTECRCVHCGNVLENNSDAIYKGGENMCNVNLFVENRLVD